VVRFLNLSYINFIINGFLEGSVSHQIVSLLLYFSTHVAETTMEDDSGMDDDRIVVSGSGMSPDCSVHKEKHLFTCFMKNSQPVNNL
jgi:hypothetical protein